MVKPWSTDKQEESMSFDHIQSSLELLYNISRQLVSSLDLQTVLENVVSLSVSNLGAERGNLMVLDSQRRPVEAVMMYNNQRVPYTLEELSQILDQGLAGWVLRNPQAVLVTDTSQDERWVRRPDDQADRSGAKSAVVVPLKARDQLVGVLTLVHPEPGFFTQDHLNLLQSIGDQAGIAINNARLYDSLQAATQRYRELFEYSLDPILVTDLTGKILEVNRHAGQLSGTQAEGLISQSVHDLHEPGLESQANANERLSAGEILTYESLFRLAGGSSVPVEVVVYRVRLPEEDVLQWTVRDITARKELDILRNDLAVMVYHDLRSPLSNIISSLDMLEGLLHLEESSSLKTVFGIATRSTDRMQRLINSLLDINRLETGQPITNQKLVEVANLVHESADAVQPMIEGKHLKLMMNISPEVPPLRVDEDMIRRVLINLMENACKFTPMKGEINVMVETIGGEVRFCVQDTGLGIPAEAVDVIFEKFRRLNVERGPKGLGLGLSFCRLAVQAHGGRIWVESEDGKGSCFYFTLPAGR
jgi:two-component system, NtrC family, sensor histidine kinase KinB